MKKTYSSGGHFEIQYGAGYHGNLGGYPALNDSKWSKVRLYQFSHFCQKSERFIQSLALSLRTMMFNKV